MVKGQHVGMDDIHQLLRVCESDTSQAEHVKALAESGPRRRRELVLVRQAAAAHSHADQLAAPHSCAQPEALSPCPSPLTLLGRRLMKDIEPVRSTDSERRR